MKRKLSVRLAAEPRSVGRDPDGQSEPVHRAQAAAIHPLVTDPAKRPANLAACFDFAAGQPDLSSVSRDFLRETLASLARATGRNPADLPADPLALKPILAGVHPNNIFWYRNALRLVRMVLIQSGWWPAEANGEFLPLEPWVEELASLERHRESAALRDSLSNWRPRTTPH